MKVELNKLVTESRNEATMNIDELPVLDFLKLMNNEDKKIAVAVEKELNNIAKVVEKTIECLKNDGRIIYVGAGTSGRVGVLEAVECSPTFGVSNKKVVALLAGGSKLYEVAGENAEDSYEFGVTDIQQLQLNKNDIVIGIAASGRTPYVIGAIEYAKKKGANTAGICCNKNSEISKYADITIEVDNGAEVLTGSTRLKAGSSQKMVLNMISTASMIGIGKSYENLMVDVEPTNLKLVERWKRIVMDSTGCGYLEAEDTFENSGKNAKTAIIMIKKKCSKDEAEKLLKTSEGFVKKALVKKVYEEDLK